MTTQRQPQPNNPRDEQIPPESTPTMFSPLAEADQQRDVAVLQQQVRQLQQAIASQQAQIAALLQRLSQPVEAPIEIIETHESSVNPPLDATGDSAHPSGAKTTSRRGLLKWGGLGAAAALAVGAAGATGLSAAPVARAADGDDMVLGSTNSASAATILINFDNSAPQGFVVTRYPNVIPSGIQDQSASIVGIGNVDVLDAGVLGVSASNTASGVMGIALGGGPDISANGSGIIIQKASNIVGPPPGYDVWVGQLIRDSNGDMYLCMDLGNNDLGIRPRWKKLASLTNGYQGGATGLLPTPIRLYDSRKTGGPFHGNTLRSVQVAPTVPPFYPVDGVPFGAVGCVGNLTVVSPTAGGYLVIYPQGGTTPSTSTVNFGPGQTNANSFIVGLGSTGQVSIHSFTSGQCHVVLDITGFIN